VPLLLRLLGQRLGHVRLLLDAWFMRAWLIQRALAAGYTVIGCVRRDLALFDVPKPPGAARQIWGSSALLVQRIMASFRLYLRLVMRPVPVCAAGHGRRGHTFVASWS